MDRGNGGSRWGSSGGQRGSSVLDVFVIDWARGQEGRVQGNRGGGLSNWEDVLSLTGQDSFRKDQIRRRERGLGVLFGVTWDRLAGGKSVA